ncbi:MAG: protein BatD [Ardenticatenaceae bacterium]|nr:protein BatD [Ardenticatenaceae bacterium]
MLILGLVWLLLAGTVQAQDEPLVVTVDRTEVTTDDTVTLTITLSGGGGLDAPELPDLPAFALVGRSQSTQMSIVNGVISTGATYTYRLQPVQTGTVEIAGITAVIDGQSYTADSITITITAGVRPTLPPGVDPDVAQLTSLGMFMEALVDNPTPYVGEQILYSVRILHPSNTVLYVPYQLPNFGGFWSQGTSETTYVEPRQGRNLRVIDVATVLFPQAAGETVIGAATLDLPGAEAVDGLHTEPVTVQARPLPEPQPAGFSGSVGQLELKTAVDKNTVAVGEAIKLQVLLSGAGNIPALAAPELPTMPGWRAFDLTQQTESETRNGRLVGARLYEQIWVPETGGDVVIPAVEYSYFDPQSESYQTLRSEPIPITVTGEAVAVAETAVPVATAVAVAEAPAAEPVADQSAVRGLKEAALGGKTAVVFPVRLGYWLLWLLPPLLVGGWVGWERWQAAQAAVPRRKRAFANAQRRLKEGAQLPPEELSQRVLLGYLSDKLEQPIAGLPQQTQLALLQAQGLADERVAQVGDLLRRLETERFAPLPNGGEAAIVAETRQLVEALEGIWER